jgi:ABC-type maltose transport system permease subunit
MGDVNGDGIVSAIDVNLCNAYLLNPSSVPDYFDTIAADVDESGSVDAADVTAIINLILKP